MCCLRMLVIIVRSMGVVRVRIVGFVGVIAMIINRYGRRLKISDQDINRPVEFPVGNFGPIFSVHQCERMGPMQKLLLLVDVTATV